MMIIISQTNPDLIDKLTFKIKDLINHLIDGDES